MSNANFEASPATGMKQWPPANETVYFEDLVEPLREALGAAYELTRLNPNHDIPYTGYNIGQDDLATCFDPQTALSAEILSETEEDQGRDAATVIIDLAVKLGIEQGRRIAAEKYAERAARTKRYLDMAAETLET